MVSDLIWGQVQSLITLTQVQILPLRPINPANVTDVTVDVSRLRHQAEYVFTDTQLDWFNEIMDSEDGRNFQFVADELSKEPMMPALKILIFNAFDYINHFTCN